MSKSDNSARGVYIFVRYLKCVFFSFIIKITITALSCFFMSITDFEYRHQDILVVSGHENYKVKVVDN